MGGAMLLRGVSVLLAGVLCLGSVVLYIPLLLTGALALVLKHVVGRHAGKCLFTTYKHKHVLVTGGSSGIGLELAKQAYKEGARVTIVARNPETLSKAACEIETSSKANEARVQVISLDLAALNAAETLSQRLLGPATNSYGPVEVCFCNAGYFVCMPFEDKGILKNHRQTMDVNYFGVVNTIHAVCSALDTSLQSESSASAAASRPSSLRLQKFVLLSSMAGQVGVYGYSSYSSSKFALRGLAEALHMEFLQTNTTGRFKRQISLAFPPDTETPGYSAEVLTRNTAAQAIAESGGLMSAAHVAVHILEQTKQEVFLQSVSESMQSVLLMVNNACMSPNNGLVHTLLDFCLLPVSRIGALVFHHETQTALRNTRSH